MGSPRRSARSRQPSSQHPSHSSSSSSSSARSRHSRHPDHDSHPDLDTSYHRGRGASEFDPQPDSASANNDEAMEGGDAEDEITRCICGYQEYQGGDDDQSDTDGLFIQCDQCSVWQHGFCVGITDSAATPDNYYCEQCKPEMHKLGHSKAGMPISTYLPSQAEPPKPITHKEATHKRRTTMNSRDADYDEVMFQKMLEMSKREAGASGETSRSMNGRNRKRGSSEGSDEPQQESKRARTSNSPLSPVNGTVGSGDDKAARVSAAPAPKRSRATANRNNSNNHSNATATKRTSTRNKNTEKHELKKDDSEQSDEYAPRKNNRSNHKAAEDASSAPAAAEQVPDTPQQPVKRSGRNQYTNGTTRRRTNNRHTRQSEDPNDSNVASPMAMTRGHSSVGQKDDNPALVIEKPTRPRIPQARMSLNEMKKRVSSISEYITRTQVEMANMGERDVYAYLAYMEDKGTPLSGTTPRSNGSSSDTPTSAPSASFNEKAVPSIQVNGGANTGNVLAKASEALSSGFASGAVDMMELLSNKINRWQQNYGEKI